MKTSLTTRWQLAGLVPAQAKGMEADTDRLALITALREHLLQLANERLPDAQSSAQADAVLDTNSRSVWHTLATALLTCPNDVRLTQDVSNLPPFLKPAGFRDTNEAPLTTADLFTRQRSCATCSTAFVAPKKNNIHPLPKSR